MWCFFVITTRRFSLARIIRWRKCDLLSRVMRCQAKCWSWLWEPWTFAFDHRFFAQLIKINLQIILLVMFLFSKVKVFPEWNQWDKSLNNSCRRCTKSKHSSLRSRNINFHRKWFVFLVKCHKGHQLFEDGFFSDPQRRCLCSVLRDLFTAKASVISFLKLSFVSLSKVLLLPVIYNK